jgi:hypothetical protein
MLLLQMVMEAEGWTCRGASSTKQSLKVVYGKDPYSRTKWSIAYCQWVVGGGEERLLT